MNGAADRFDVVQMGEGKVCYFRDLEDRACEADVLGDVVCLRRDGVHLVCLRRATLERLLRQLPSEEVMHARGQRRQRAAIPAPAPVATPPAVTGEDTPLAQWGLRPSPQPGREEPVGSGRSEHPTSSLSGEPTSAAERHAAASLNEAGRAGTRP